VKVWFTRALVIASQTLQRALLTYTSLLGSWLVKHMNMFFTKNTVESTDGDMKFYLQTIQNAWKDQKTWVSFSC